MHDSELIRRYTLDRAGIMFVTDLTRDTLISPTPCRNAIAPEMDVITTLTTLTYLATGKMQLCSSDDLGLLQHFQNLIVSLFISCEIRQVWQHGIKKIKNIMCVRARAREKEYGKTGKMKTTKWRLIINPTLKSALLFPSWTTNQSQSSKDWGSAPPPH